ncbi:methyltransferase family protein [Pleomorphomonas oryzae]|uniref:methyltransferase family protein n=1 Tax=Pleomorphomonas oryzae TaxID=261934 RepID=UPI0003F5F590|nr:isoprenylcysteine carboxylmethyltransferase family protein [Pleomorphomonas oryzae]
MKDFIVSSAVSLVFLLVLLLSAGRADYMAAWVYFGVSLLTNALRCFILRGQRELSQERLRPGSGAEEWDKRLLGIGFLLTIATLILAGLDAGRFGWTPRQSWIWMAIGTFVTLIGAGLFLWAMAENRFFSAVVRIQRDRSHRVCETGPYRIVRHPGNTGMIIGTLGLPLLFGSAWSTIPTLLAVVLLIVRTRLEDALLERELAGYDAYQRQTRYRLMPGVW